MTRNQVMRSSCGRSNGRRGSWGPLGCSHVLETGCDGWNELDCEGCLGDDVPSRRLLGR